MYKVVLYISFAAILLSGCAVNGRRAETKVFSGGQNAKEILRNVSSKNLTATGFFIQKGRISTYSSESRITLFFTMKYNTAGNYLISVRSRTGMEAFRAFMTKDTVLINDRLNKRLLYGNPRDFTYISGLPVELLKISVGDIYMNMPQLSETGCLNNEFEVSDICEGLKISAKIDCRREKMKHVSITGSQASNSIIIDYNKFKEDSYGVPEKIEINDAYKKIRFVISIDKYIAPWVGEFEFIPGSNYTRTPLR
ncbi:MAG TPA: DUF4292 domain-containing protein [Bacteroidales bacterium]|nr:DUF4292 domain-containing protein [Bacteroidales bacterium]